MVVCDGTLRLELLARLEGLLVPLSGTGEYNLLTNEARSHRLYSMSSELPALFARLRTT